MKPSSSPGIDPKRSPIPAKWIVALVALALVYALLQPWANRRFGWNLPSLGQLANSQSTSPKGSPGNRTGTDRNDSNRSANNRSASNRSASNRSETNDEGTVERTDQQGAGPLSKSSDSSLDNSEDMGQSSESDLDQTNSLETDNSTERPSAEKLERPQSERNQRSATTQPDARKQDPSSFSRDNKSSSAPTANPSRPSNSSGPLSNRTNNEKQERASDSPYDLLKSIGSDAYLSQAGLRYTRGSEDGHRIKHLERHRRDIPDRPGRHGVFKGDWQQTLKWVDDAYTRSKKPDRFTKVRQEDSRTIIETEFSSPIGFIGGRDGSRAGNPSTRRLRLVVEGDRFITAFPY